ncbi:arginine--tRNA ligase, partial [Francisella tularensis]|uniref:arginine--tRNA ligase domain-containing protein n=1 Tax=Francisella tularensis TaxID=263 RepID=UPI002381B696
RISIDAFKKDFDSLDVHFELCLGESDDKKFIDEMISYFQANKFIYEDEGAWVIDTNKEGVPPLVVIKKEGGVMYGA